MLPETFTPQFLNQLELFKIRARRAFLGSRQGGHLSPKRGHGIEFSDYRKYELGDNPRHIDWGVYGRTDRLYVKRFQEEQDLRVLILVDGSASMGENAFAPKWQRARDIALSLGYIALMEQDTVSTTVLGKRSTPVLAGPRAVHQLGTFFEELGPGGEDHFARDLQRAAAQSKFPGVAVVLSDFLCPFEEIERGLNALRARNLDITVVQVLSDEDLRPLEGKDSGIVVDSESGERVDIHFTPELRSEYQELLEAHCEELRDFCGSARISYALALASEDLGGWVQDILPRVGILR
jgi:uncharacterized protein (DUF58 family)